MANPLSRRPAGWIVAAFVVIAVAITVLLGKAVTLAVPPVPRSRPGTGGPTRTYLPRPDGLT
jgi:hypothetical protein